MSQTSRRDSARPVAPYIGGKRILAKTVIARIEAIPHELYGEAFVGMGGVFLRRRQPAKLEVINDLSRDVATLFRVLQRHYLAFVEMLRWQLTTRSDFDRLLATDPGTMTDLERAARFVYLQRTAFGGKVEGRNFGITRTVAARFDVTKIVPLLEAAHERLAGVVIESLPYARFLEQYDRKGALFYLDPPYLHCERDYGDGVFERADFERIAALLASLKAQFILSINDRPEMRRIFKAFRIEPVKVTYRIAGGAVTPARELIITRR